jgi:serine protease Do
MFGKSDSRLAAAIVLALAAAARPAAALTPADLYAKVSPSVWMVQADHASPGTGEAGSAVALGSRTLATACHVVDGATSVQVTHDKGKTMFPVSQVTHDPGHGRDLCMLTVNEDLTGAPVVIAPGDSIVVGERVYALGAPLGLELSLTEGLVSSLRPMPGETLPAIQFSAATAPGSSGGGLFDDQGRLVGLTVSLASKESENLSFAYPAQWTVELSARVMEARRVWRARLAATGVPLGPNGDAAASGYAELSDVTKIPLGGKPAKGVADAYRQFLLLAKPRAFMLTSDERWGTVSDAAALDALMKDCAARGVRCRLYAVDDAVVWRP